MDIHRLTLTADAAGADQADTRTVNARVVAVFYRPTDLGAGTTLTVTTVTTEQTILNAVAVGAANADFLPGALVQDSAGDDIPATYDYRPAAQEAVRAAIAGASEGETGVVFVVTE